MSALRTHFYLPVQGDRIQQHVSRLLQADVTIYMHHVYRLFGRSLPSMPKHRPVPGFDPEKHGEALKAALVETRFQQTALAEQGDVDSMVLLGSMHFRGQGGPQDFAEARRLFQMAADLGSAAARTNLARMHMKGDRGCCRERSEYRRREGLP